jgi:hypothetical protein
VRKVIHRKTNSRPMASELINFCDKIHKFGRRGSFITFDGRFTHVDSRPTAVETTFELRSLISNHIGSDCGGESRVICLATRLGPPVHAGGLFLRAMPLKHLLTGRAELGSVLLQALLNGTVIP